MYRDRLSLQAEFDTLSTGQIEEQLHKSQHTPYEYGGKASELLYDPLHQSSSAQHIIQMPTGATIDPHLINNKFKDSFTLRKQSADPSAFDKTF